MGIPRRSRSRGIIFFFAACLLVVIADGSTGIIRTSSSWSTSSRHSHVSCG